METSELEKQIAERKQAATDKKLTEKAQLIVGVMGGSRAHNHVLPTMSYASDGVRINWHRNVHALNRDFGTSLVIFHNGHDVFQLVGHEIYRYIPGPWEEVLEVIYHRAIQMQPTLAAAHRLKRDLLQPAELVERSRKFGL